MTVTTNSNKTFTDVKRVVNVFDTITNEYFFVLHFDDYLTECEFVELNDLRNIAQ